MLGHSLRLRTNIEPAPGQPFADLEFKQLTDWASCKESQSPDSPVCANSADLSEAVPKHW